MKNKILIGMFLIGVLVLVGCTTNKTTTSSNDNSSQAIQNNSVTEKVETGNNSNTNIEPAPTGDITKVDFSTETFGGPSEYFSSFIGTWYIDKDKDNLVYAVDGRKWAQGTMNEGIAEKAKALYGERYGEFLDNIKAYDYFPLSIYKGIDNFGNGAIGVSFKGVSGRIDQAAGIAFNIKQNGDYLVIRANPVENNMVLFKMEKGHRSSEQWIRNVPIDSGKWYSLKVVIKDNNVEGYLDNKKYIDYKHKEKINGKVGLWSKSDSYVFFDDFIVQPQ